MKNPETGQTARGYVVQGTHTTQPAGAKNTEVTVFDAYVVQGLEAENDNPEVYSEGIHHIDVSPGHAFQYVVVDKKIVRILSFGPINSSYLPDFLNQYNAATGTLGTPDFPVPEKSHLFKLPIQDQAQLAALLDIMDFTRQQIISGKLLYQGISMTTALKSLSSTDLGTALQKAAVNTTCASTNKNILDKVGIQTPSAMGWVDIKALKNYPSLNPHDGAMPSVHVDTQAPYVHMTPGRLPTMTTEKHLAPQMQASPVQWYYNFKKDGRFKEAVIHKGFSADQEGMRSWLGKTDPAGKIWQ